MFEQRKRLQKKQRFWLQRSSIGSLGAAPFAEGLIRRDGRSAALRPRLICLQPVLVISLFDPPTHPFGIYSPGNGVYLCPQKRAYFPNRFNC